MANILFSCQNFLNQVGGAEISIQTLAKALAKKHRVHVLSCGSGGDYTWEGVMVHEVSCPSNIFYINVFWGRYLDRLGFLPDLIFTQVNAAAPTVFWAKNKGVPVITYVRSFEHFCLDSFKGGDVFECDHQCFRCEGLKGLLFYPAYKIIYDRNREALLESDYVLCQSRFMQETVRHYTGRDCTLLPNIMDLNSQRVEGRGDAILFVKPIKIKGVDVVAELVELLPGKKFLFAGETQSEYAYLCSRENVECLGHVQNMREAYCRAKILLAPSVMADSSPRVVYEAMINGIPCITSNVGGAAEVGGNAAIKLPRQDTDAWASEINRLFEDQEYYEHKSRESRVHAENYTLKKSLGALNGFLAGKLGFELF
ncbi:MAG: glycosyltransferase [Candidatus Altiarchaeales archaeon]|nr:glycosyltransferase [Candidatus Altiarchaeales archaeon]